MQLLDWGYIEREYKHQDRSADHLHFHLLVIFTITTRSVSRRIVLNSVSEGRRLSWWHWIGSWARRNTCSVPTDGQTSLISFGLIISPRRSSLLRRYVKTTEVWSRYAQSLKRCGQRENERWKDGWQEQGGRSEKLKEETEKKVEEEKGEENAERERRNDGRW